MIIDFHAHVFPSQFRDRGPALLSGEPAFASIYRSPKARVVGAQDLLRNMEEEGVRKSVIFGFPWEKPENYQRHNDYVLESVNRYPDRLIGFCAFSPLAPGGAGEAERCLKAGLSGVGELAVYGSGLNHDVVKALGEVMALCVHLDVPFLLHTNEPVGHVYPGKAPMTLNEIYRFIQTYPLNRIVLAHWGGGLFFYGLMKKEVKEVLRNVWFDTAASPFLYTPQVYRVAEEIVGLDKILFGSDYPLIRPGRYLKEMASAGLSREAVDRISGGNAARFLGLSPD